MTGFDDELFNKTASQVRCKLEKIYQKLKANSKSYAPSYKYALAYS